MAQLPSLYDGLIVVGWLVGSHVTHPHSVCSMKIKFCEFFKKTLVGLISVLRSFTVLQAVDELLTADVDSRRGVFHAPDPEEDAEASRAKTEAYLSLIDQLDACLPSEEEMLKDTGIDERDGEGGKFCFSEEKIKKRRS